MRVVVISDLHCGHRCGLTPLQHQPRVPIGASRETRKLAEERATIWKWFVATMRELQPIDLLIVNGDAIDGHGAKSGGTEHLTTDCLEQCKIAADAINVCRAKHVCMTYGTPYHVGEAEDWEAVLARNVDHCSKLEAEGHYDILGLQVVARHYIGNTASPMSRGSALAGAQIRQMLWAIRGHQPLANIIIRSHVHRAFMISDPAANFAACVTPALQGPGSKYGTRKCDGLPVDVGCVSLDVSSAQTWNIKFHLLRNGSKSQITHFH